MREITSRMVKKAICQTLSVTKSRSKDLILGKLSANSVIKTNQRKFLWSTIIRALKSQRTLQNMGPRQMFFRMPWRKLSNRKSIAKHLYMRRRAKALKNLLNPITKLRFMTIKITRAIRIARAILLVEKVMIKSSLECQSQ